MRTTLDIERELLEKAQRVLGASTYRETVERALGEVVERGEVRRILEEVEGSDPTWDLDELLAFRRLDRGDAS